MTGRPTDAAAPSSALVGGQVLPAELQELAEAIRVAQQRIEASSTTAEHRAQLARDLRRAVQAGRDQPAEGRRRLGALHARMDAAGC